MATRSAADWTGAAPYRAMLGYDAAFFAWEWLRRMPEYRRSARGSAGNPARFGLHRFEDPDQAAGSARIWWRAEIDPMTLAAVAEPSRDAAAFDLATIPFDYALETNGRGGENLLIGDDQRMLRIDIARGTLRCGPVRLTWQIAGMEAAIGPMITLKRVIALRKFSILPPSGHPSRAVARRWALLLRVQDALLDGASQQEIARVLYGPSALGQRWRVDAPSYRLRVQRLVRAARRMADRSPVELLQLPAVGRTAWERSILDWGRHAAYGFSSR